MPISDARTFARAEWEAYREFCLRRQSEDPDYTVGWHRPTDATASQAWTLVEWERGRPLSGPLGIVPEYPWLRPDELETLRARAKQALVLALDAAICAGESGRMLTENTVFDALGACFSDHYRKAIEDGPARGSYEMSVATVRGAWRDLIRNGLRFKAALALRADVCAIDRRIQDHRWANPPPAASR